jgi:hypothetical protein
MIKPSIYNALNFSNDFNRESKFFDAKLQRVKNIFSLADAYLSFYFKPSAMPEGAAPTATLTVDFNDGTVTTGSSGVLTLTDGYIYFFEMAFNYSVERFGVFRLTMDGYDDIIFSEISKFIPAADLVTESIVKIIAYNNDATHGYLTSTYPACAFFEVSKLNENVFGNSKVEYKYSYGRVKILNSENYIKTRLTFNNLSMYQQNLLKFLCNCENLTIDGVGYYLASEFTEKNKNEENEICDLQADFVLISDPTFFATGAAEMPGAIDPTNLFIH